MVGLDDVGPEIVESGPDDAGDGQGMENALPAKRRSAAPLISFVLSSAPSISV
jgi:hypothetical protein